MTIEYSNNWSIVTGWGVCGLDKFYGASLPKILQRSSPHAPRSTIRIVQSGYKVNRTALESPRDCD